MQLSRHRALRTKDDRTVRAGLVLVESRAGVSYRRRRVSLPTRHTKGQANAPLIASVSSSSTQNVERARPQKIRAEERQGARRPGADAKPETASWMCAPRAERVHCQLVLGGEREIAFDLPRG